MVYTKNGFYFTRTTTATVPLYSSRSVTSKNPSAIKFLIAVSTSDWVES